MFLIFPKTRLKLDFAITLAAFITTNFFTVFHAIHTAEWTYISHGYASYSRLRVLHVFHRRDNLSGTTLVFRKIFLWSSE